MYCGIYWKTDIGTKTTRMMLFGNRKTKKPGAMIFLLNASILLEPLSLEEAQDEPLAALSDGPAPRDRSLIA